MLSIGMNQKRTHPEQVPDVYDIEFDADGNLVMVSDGEAVAQLLRQRLEMYLGEWFLDRSRGTDWMGSVYKLPYNQAVAEAEIVRVVNETPGVAKILSINIKRERVRRFAVRKLVILTTFNTEVSI